MMPTKARSSKGSSSWAIHWGDGLTDLTGLTEGLQVQSVQSVHVSRTYVPTVLTGTAYDKRTQRRVRRRYHVGSRLLRGLICEFTQTTARTRLTS